DVTLAANPQTGIHEHMEYRWVKRDDAAAMVTPRVQQILEWAEKCMAGGEPPLLAASPGLPV
ncbi:MAG TPA: hypothetical protein VGT99_10665, partial [Gammaproteobacteria bacterium]|nr:hypothetical protein [Gammaproteobacteria bacterium]